MNKLHFTLNAIEVKNPAIECSIGFDKDIIQCLKEHTSIDIELPTCKKDYFTCDGLNMVRFTFDNLSNERLIEFEQFSKLLYIALNNTINHAQN